MADNNPGLHKKISSIFDGVPVPKDDGLQPPSYVPQKNNVPQPPDMPKEKNNQNPLSAPEDAGARQLMDNQQDTADQKSVDTPANARPVDIKREPPVQKRQSPPKGEPLEARQSQPTAACSKFMKTVFTVKAEVQKWCRLIWRQINDRLLAPKPGVNPARQKAMAILVPILFIVLIFVFINLFSTPACKTTKDTNLGPAAAFGGSDKPITWQIPEPYPTALRDPMQFGSVTSNRTETAHLTVKGIVYSRDNPTAVIGTEIVHEGDEISGVAIVKIKQDSVEFESNGKKWTQKVQR